MAQLANECERAAYDDQQSSMDAHNYMESVKHLLDTARAVPATAENPVIPNAQVYFYNTL